MFSVQSVPVCVQCTKWLFFKTLQLELKPRYYLCLIQHLPYNSVHFIFLLEKDLHLNSLSVIDLYLKSKFPDSTSPSKKKKKWRTSYQILKPDHLIFFPSCSSSMKRIHLVWLNVSEMCLTPKLLAVIQATFLQPCMISEFKCTPCLEGNFMVENQTILNSFREDELLCKSGSVLTSILYHKHTYPCNSWDISFLPQGVAKRLGLPRTAKSKKIRY